MKHIWCCTCGQETEVEPNTFDLGAVFQCPSCLVVYGCVRPRYGSKVWVPIQPKDVEFHKLLLEIEDE